MKTRHYSATREGSHVIVRARDSEAKQIFFGWGSGSNSAEAAFYGREDDLGDRYTHIDNKVWRWDLSPESVRIMIGNIVDHIDDKNYYATRTEKSRAKELLGLLRKMK